MQNKRLIRVLIFGVLAIIGIMGVQTYWVTSTWNINEQEFDEKINYILYNTAGKIAELNEVDPPKKDIIIRKTPNYYIVNTNSEISPDILESFLQEEIEKWALNIDFEYGIYDCFSDEMVYGSYCDYDLEGKKYEDAVPALPISNIKTSNYYFGVRFPNRSNFLLSKMQLSIFFSIILLLTIFFFTYSMYVILRQNRLSNMQKEFINNMTHEFKTPLSTIKIASEVFLKSPIIKEDQRLRNYANIIKEQNQRLNSQVERVLNIAKLEQNNFNLKKEELSLKEVLQPIVENEKLRANERGGIIQCKLPEQDFLIRADRFHFSNVIYNLLDNSLKYCKEAPEIKIQLTEQNKSLQLSIIDNGIGISKDQLNSVFEKFYRIPTGNVHNVKGFGIGLYYVKKICEEHGWTVKLNSKEGEYTQFDIVIPQ